MPPVSRGTEALASRQQLQLRRPLASRSARRIRRRRSAVGAGVNKVNRRRNGSWFPTCYACGG